MWRPGPDGTLIHPHRGTPRCPDGYELTSDPYVVRIQIPECKDRTFIKLKKPCCGGRTGYIYCKYFEKPITRLSCVDCEEANA